MNRNRKGFTLIELLIVVVIVGILALAAIPLITANTRDARRSEGEQILGSMKGQARVAYAKLNTAPLTLTAAGVASAERTGKYFTVDDAVGGSGAQGSLTATALSANSSDGSCTHTFNWAGGDGSFAWTP